LIKPAKLSPLDRTSLTTLDRGMDHPIKEYLKTLEANIVMLVRPNFFIREAVQERDLPHKIAGSARMTPKVDSAKKMCQGLTRFLMMLLQSAVPNLFPRFSAKPDLNRVHHLILPPAKSKACFQNSRTKKRNNSFSKSKRPLWISMLK